MIDSNIGSDKLNATEIEKAREVRNKLVSTYQYAKHKRGKNPFNMLMTGRKEDKKKGVVAEVLQKTEKTPFAKTLHFMNPLDRNKDSAKTPDESIEQKKSPTVEILRKSCSVYSRGSVSSTIDCENEKKLKPKKEKPKMQRREYKSAELRQVSGVIMQECRDVMMADLKLKREIDVGLQLKEIESYVDANPQLKEARILREIGKFEKEVKKRNEALKRGLSENALAKID